MDIRLRACVRTHRHTCHTRRALGRPAGRRPVVVVVVVVVVADRTGCRQTPTFGHRRPLVCMVAQCTAGLPKRNTGQIRADFGIPISADFGIPISALVAVFSCVSFDMRARANRARRLVLLALFVRSFVWWLSYACTTKPDRIPDCIRCLLPLNLRPTMQLCSPIGSTGSLTSCRSPSITRIPCHVSGKGV